MDIDKLTAEEKKELRARLAAEERVEKERKARDKAAFKQMEHDYVEEYFGRLQKLSEQLSREKDVMFDSSRAVIDLKAQVLGIGEAEMALQQSHSIPNKDFSKTIIIGHNVLDRWDNDMTGVGMNRVREWLKTQMTDENAVLIGFITDLLKPNKDGVLKASRVLDLDNKAREIGDAELIDAVAMIKEAYRPIKSSTYVKAKMRDENGQERWLSLSMSNA